MLQNRKPNAAMSFFLCPGSCRQQGRALHFMTRLFRSTMLLWPARVWWSRRNDSEARDNLGRRYGAYFWLTLSLGHVHFNVFPKHVRRCWVSIYWREIWSS